MVTAVMFNKLPAAVEIIGMDRSVIFSDLCLLPTFFLDRLFLAMIILGAGQAAFAT
jgi:hypothetical protein